MDTYIPSENPAKYNWQDVPGCAKPCILDKQTGYWYERCSRSDGGCCPDTKPEGVSHLQVWDCVWQSCQSDPGKAQYTAEIFMRECASAGQPLSPNFTISVPSTVAGDHFPPQYQYKDFVTPAEVSPISGLYGGGTLIAWAIAMVAAAFSGIRPSSGRRRARNASSVSGVWELLRQWIWYLRRDAELIVALALPCVAAGDIKLRWRRVDFYQVFGYSNPSFVPASDGDTAVPDILTLRSALIVINHFLVSALPVTIGPLVALGYAPNPSGPIRHVVRTLLIWATMIWCLAITKPLYCQASPMMQNWPGGCRITNIGMSDLAAKSDMIPGVGCGDNDAPVFFMGFIGFVCAVLACGFFLKIEPNTHLSLWIPGIVALGAVFFLILYPFFVVLAYMMDFFLTTLVVPFAYLTTYGRQCVFGPSNMIAFSELDQVFALVVGICAGVASIWDSVTAYRESFHGEVVVAENIEMSAAVAPAPSV